VALCSADFTNGVQTPVMPCDCRSDDRLDDRPVVRDEHHKEAQHAAHDQGCGLAVPDVHPDEHEAVESKHLCCPLTEVAPPARGG